MKKNLFLLTVLLISSVVSLRAIPGMDKPLNQGEGRKVHFSEEADKRYAPQERDSSFQSRENNGLSTALDDSINSREEETATPPQPKEFEGSLSVDQAKWKEQRLAYAQQLIQEACQALDPYAAAWSKATALVRVAKKWSDTILNPPALTIIDRWFGTQQATYSSAEINAAKFVKLKALALEAALPAWKATTAAWKARELALAPKVGDSAQGRINCSAFFRNAFVVTVDLRADAIKKAYEAKLAWEDARINLRNQSSSLSHEPKIDDNVLLTSASITNTSEKNLPDAWANELKYLDYAKEASKFNFLILKAQQKVEKALQDYEEKRQPNDHAVIEAINELVSYSEKIDLAKKTSPPQFQECWDQELKQLTYIIARYEAQLGSATFYRTICDFQREESDSNRLNLEELETNVLEKLDRAIAAKLNTLPEESQERVKQSLNSTEVVELTPKEEAAKQRILEFEEEKELISKDSLTK